MDSNREGNPHPFVDYLFEALSLPFGRRHLDFVQPAVREVTTLNKIGR